MTRSLSGCPMLNPASYSHLPQRVIAGVEVSSLLGR